MASKIVLAKHTKVSLILIKYRRKVELYLMAKRKMMSVMKKDLPSGHG